MASTAQVTVVVAVAVSVGALVAVVVAELAYVPHAEMSVLLVTWTVTTAPPARSPRAQVSTWLPAAPVIAHGVPVTPVTDPSDQPTSAPAGKGSFRTTPSAVPLP